MTAERYSRLLSSLGYRARVVSSEGPLPEADLLVALHARRSARIVAAFGKAFPERPVIVVLTGTDVYASGGLRGPAMKALERADAIVALQPLAIRRLSAALRRRAVAVIQSAEPRLEQRRQKTRRRVRRLCVLGHLRREKDPLRAAYALAFVNDGAVEIVQAGGILEPRYAERVAAIERREPRYRYVGEISRTRSLRLLAGCDALVLSSRSEGGANVASEAIAQGIPVIASRIDGNVGVFGTAYSGYYQVGSSRDLARVMDRFFRDAAFANRLRAQIRDLQPEIEPRREREGLARAIALALRNAVAARR